MHTAPQPSKLASWLINRAAPKAGKPAPHAGGAARPCPPALTGGESTQRAKIDWCTFTWKPEPDEIVEPTIHALICDLMGGVFGESVNGMFGYQSAVRFYVPVNGVPVHVGRLDYGGDHHRGRARLDLSGVGCSRVLDFEKLQQVIESSREAKLTRVDIAVDAMDGEFTVEHAVDWYQSGDFNAGGRTPRHALQGDWLSPAYGRTFEVGRRENGKMLRCYEKGRQLGDQSSPWTRFEVEIRNNDRDIPTDILTKPDTYFTGAYKCLERVLDAAATRIKTHQKEGEISLELMTGYAMNSYGSLVHVLRASLTSDEVIEAISRPGIPKRLERSGLHGFLNAHLPGQFH